MPARVDAANCAALLCSHICIHANRLHINISACVCALYKWPHVACLIILDCMHAVAVAVAAAGCRRLSAIVRSCHVCMADVCIKSQIFVSNKNTNTMRMRTTTKNA